MTKKTCVILGMGRSGTSMLAGILEILGVDFGGNLHGPNRYNPHGHFENADIVNVNELVLGTLKKDPTPRWAIHRNGPPKQWLHPSIIKDFSRANKFIPVIKNILSKQIIPLDLPGIKDPRITLLFPFYKNIFNELNIEPYIIHIKRNPKAVAKSLFNFHNFQVPEEEAIKLCHRYNNDVNQFCVDEKQIEINYENILDDALNETLRLAAFLDLTVTDHKKEQVNNFIDSKLNHG